MDRIWKLTLFIVILILADQFTKGVIQQTFQYGESREIIKGFFDFTYVKNSGAAFGFLANAHDSIRAVLFLYVPVIACLWLMYLIWMERKKSLLLSCAYASILGGAIGNLIDRFSMNYVVDFLDFYYKDWHFPAFNIADMGITIGGGLLIVDLVLQLNKVKEDSKKKII